ncbi:MAG: hypothetical protein COB08_001725 [Rhodobacteraceae bacterium]|nr:hypothetical protein [Paracoccaceae bacterium]
MTILVFVDATRDANLPLLAGLTRRIGNDHGVLQAISAPMLVGGRDRFLPIDRDAMIAGFKV